MRVARRRLDCPVHGVACGGRLQNAGMLPTPLSRIGFLIDAHRAASRAVEVLNRYGSSPPTQSEVLSALKAP
jgi:hypothetical protein